MNSSDTIDVKQFRHKAEKPLNIISLLLSIAIYIVLTLLAVRAANEPDLAEMILGYLGDDVGLYDPLLKYGSYFVILAFVVTYVVVCQRE